MTLSEQAIKELKKSILKLEGVAEGLGTFYPRVSHYIQQQVDAMSRILYEEADSIDSRHLSGKTPLAFQEADREVAEHPEDFELAEDGDYPVRKPKKTRATIRDRKIVEGAEDGLAA